jgi:gamma-glutamyltranspeptidase
MVITTTEPTVGQSELFTDGGMVTAYQHLAAEAGARMLARGGNSMNAAAATAFAAGVVEPAMSGLGGRGYLVIYLLEKGAGASILLTKASAPAQRVWRRGSGRTLSAMIASPR